MARAEVGTAKHQSKQLKASGLQKLKFFCQICEKQCRDANGFKNHLSSPSHQGRIQELSETGKGRAVIEEYSLDFQRDFLRLLKVNHGTKKVNANKFYQEYILNDRNHVHMNSTKWNSLTAFVKHLGRNGLVRVEQDGNSEEDGFALEIRFIDPAGELKQVNLQEKQKQLASEEEVSMKLIKKQISWGKQAEKVEEEIVPPTKSGPVKLTIKPTFKKPVRNVSAFGSDSDSESEGDDKIPPKKIPKIANSFKRR